ncbi:MAG: hypothetical protein JRG91_16625 [Deltaproteobacteria bacterium]|nr:hypothetical protein [Deltaproteobacteria bacterium]
METEIRSRKAAGCLVAALVPAVLVVALIFASGLFMLTFKFFGLASVNAQTTQRLAEDWYSIIVSLTFSFPFLVVLTRALHAAIVYTATGRKIPLVTWKLVMPASILLGLPGLAFCIMALGGMIPVDASTAIWGLAGSLILVLGPLALYRVQARQKTRSS